MAGRLVDPLAQLSPEAEAALLRDTGLVLLPPKALPLAAASASTSGTGAFEEGGGGGSLGDQQLEEEVGKVLEC